ncbi:hypothetical protein CBR_g51474 [Chara braunii]|uniref:Cilia- and flagella-associated protein 58 central coiled coil domain-containing protein n=1 Tax=Chara braunii TaxID=69332 RepID=A0A388K6B7_CHABU|nr:hypothetical protein CBR_g51474 [Chara braunii]|eukprot:GBG65592.1 hypothetical protein CBR_g51474 [Chara braunii]
MTDPPPATQEEGPDKIPPLLDFEDEKTLEERFENRELEDVANSVALKELDDLIMEGVISEERAAFARDKYLNLHRAFIETMASDRDLLSQARVLNKRLAESKEQTEKVQQRAQEGVSVLELLREDSEQAESEALICREKEQMLEMEETELTRIKEQHQKRFQEIEKEHAAAVVPQIRRATEEIEETDMRLKENMEKIEKLVEEVKEVNERADRTIEETESLRLQKELEANSMEKKANMPDKYKKQTEAVNQMIKQYKAQEAKLATRIKEHEVEHSKLLIRIKELTEEMERANTQHERVKMQAEQKERGADEIKKNVEIAGIEADQYLADRVNVDMLLKSTVAEVRRESEELAQRVKDKDGALRRYKKAEAMLKQAQDTLPMLNMIRDQVFHQIQGVENERKRQSEHVVELKKEVDITMNSFLHEQELGKEKAAQVRECVALVEELESEVGALAMQERRTNRLIADLASQRERISRFCSAKIALQREASEKIRVKDLVINDLKKKLRDRNLRFKEFMQLYDLVKNQRNKFVTLIQSASQSIAEMREKLRILGAEIDILRNEIAYKHRLLAKAKAEHAASLLERERLRTELAKSGMVLQEKQRIVDEQISKMDRLNGIITVAERAMLHVKRQYEIQVESRNYTGITLIDRNDELCILYERLNIMGQVHRQSDIEMLKREDEIRVLRAHIAEFESSLRVARKRAPKVGEVEHEIQTLKEELEKARAEVVRLSDLLENPSNKERWRQLEGKTPKADELATILQSVEDKLGDRKEQLMERELVYQEVTKLSTKLRQQAADGRKEAIFLAGKANKCRKKMMDTIRKIMATVAELSLCQATAIRLAETRDDLKNVVFEAAKRLERGEAPTEDASREWYRMERERLIILELAERRTAAFTSNDGPVLEGGMRNKPTFTAAEQRPNAYLPEELAIPRPYGQYAPFKPSDLGPTMRHYRKPEPKPIEV